MAFDARQVALRRPAAVAVHDDGDVRGQLLEVDLPRQRLVGRSRRNPRQELLKRHQGLSRKPNRNISSSRPTPATARGPARWPLRRRARGRRGWRKRPRRGDAAADVHERARHGAHHVPEEPVGRDLEHHQAGARDRGLGNRRGRRRLPGSQTLTSACVTVRMACATVLPVDWKALKSCVPRNVPAASRIASTSSGPATADERSATGTGWRVSPSRIRYRYVLPRAEKRA